MFKDYCIIVHNIKKLATTIPAVTIIFVSSLFNLLNFLTVKIPTEQESVRPRWPYDMRPSVRAEKYIRDASG